MQYYHLAKWLLAEKKLKISLSQGLCIQLSKHAIMVEEPDMRYATGWAVAEEMQDIIQQWPHGTGDSAYPLTVRPMEPTERAQFVYVRCGRQHDWMEPMWSNEVLAYKYARRALLYYIFGAVYNDLATHREDYKNCGLSVPSANTLRALADTAGTLHAVNLARSEELRATRFSRPTEWLMNWVLAAERLYGRWLVRRLEKAAS